MDASALLSIYLNEQESERAGDVINTKEAVVSSWLLLPEVVVTLRRELGRTAKGRAALDDALMRFDEDLGDLELTDDVAAISDRIRNEPRLALCRTLDAIHVASALWFQESTGVGVRVATLDRRLAEVAEAVGLELALAP